MKNRLWILTILILAAMVVSACSPAPAQTAAPAVESAPASEVTAVEASPAEPESQSAPQVTQPGWYAMELTDVNTGSVFRVADLQGKVVLVETMAVWCSNCFRQQLEVKELHDLIGDREDFVGLGIDIDPNESVPQLTGYVKENGFDWLYAVASTELINEISDLHGPQFLNPPSTPMLIIDKQGEANLLPFGIKSADELLEFLQPFLDES